MSSFSELQSELETLFKNLDRLVVGFQQISVPAERVQARNHLVNVAVGAREATRNYLSTHFDGTSSVISPPEIPSTRPEMLEKPSELAKNVAIHDQIQNFQMVDGGCGVSSIANLFSLACPDLVSNLGSDIEGVRRLNSHLIQASIANGGDQDGGSTAAFRGRLLRSIVPHQSSASTWTTLNASLADLRTAISKGHRAVVGVWIQTLIHESEVVPSYDSQEFEQFTDPEGRRQQNVWYEDDKEFRRKLMNSLGTNHAVVFMGFEERKGEDGVVEEGVVLADTGGWNAVRGNSEGVVFWAPVARFQEAWKGSANYVNTKDLSAYCSQLLSKIKSYRYDKQNETNPDVLAHLNQRAEML